MIYLCQSMRRTSPTNEPIYREVLKHAFRTAWFDRRYWILAVLAGILVTAGSYDVLIRAVSGITNNGQFLSFLMDGTVGRILSEGSANAYHNTLSVIGGVEVLMFLTMLILATAAISCVAQGGLVFALGARKRGLEPTATEAFRVGAQAFWPVVSLNVLVYAVLWILRFLAAFPLFLALNSSTQTNFIIYLVSFLVFLPLSFLTAIIQIFALNGMVLQGSTLGDALRRSFALFKKNWLVVLETAVIQIFLGFGVWFLFVLGLLLLLIPAFIMVMAAAIMQSGSLFVVAMIVGALIFVCALLTAAAFTIQLQYATWTYLYRRLGEGGVLPKLHRIARSLTGHYEVPQG